MDRLKRFIRVLRIGAKTEPQDVLTILAAVVVGLLALLNVISKVEVLIGVVLAVLAVQAFSAMKHGVRIKDLESAVGSLKEAVDTDSATTGTVSASVRSLSEQYERSRMVRELSSREAIAEAFATSLSGSRTWMYQGGTGTFLRSTTLPTLADMSRPKGGANYRVSIDILNPRLPTLLEEYASYRRTLAERRSDDKDAEYWTSDAVWQECFAAIAAAVWYSQHEGLSIDMYLSDQMSVFRYDVSDSSVLVTHEDKNFPALVASVESRIYAGFVAELQRRAKRAIRLDLERAPHLPRLTSKWQTSDVQRLITWAELDGKREVSITPAALAALSLDRADPYARSS